MEDDEPVMIPLSMQPGTIYELEQVYGLNYWPSPWPARVGAFVLGIVIGAGGWYIFMA